MMAFRCGIVSVNGRSRRKFISSPVNPAEIKPLNDGGKIEDSQYLQGQKENIPFLILWMQKAQL